MVPEISDNQGNDGGFMNLLFRLRSVHCTMLFAFIIHSLLCSSRRIINSCGAPQPKHVILTKCEYDQCLPDLWHETITSTTNSNTQRWPCLYCSAKNHSQTTVLTRHFVIAHNALDHLITENPDLQYAVTITTNSVQEMHAPISTSACLARAATHTSPVQTNNEAMPGHAYTTYTTTLEHILCTEVIGYTDTFTTHLNSLDSGHTTSYIETLECNSCMEGLYHVHTPYSCTLGRNPYMVMHSQTNTHSLGTKAPQPVHIPLTTPPVTMHPCRALTTAITESYCNT